MKNKIKMLLGVVAFSTLLSMGGMAVAAPVDSIGNDITETSIEPRTDIKEWIYAVIDGDIYKRLYNYTRNRWETDWILVQESA